MLRKADELGIEEWSHFRPVKLPEREKPIWVHLDDIKKFKLIVYEANNLINNKT
jgi:hypothetical protein